MPPHPFSFTTPLGYTMQLEWLTSIPSPNSSTSSSSTPSSNEYLTKVHLEWISKHEKQQLSLLQPRSLSTSCDPVDAGRPAPQISPLANLLLSAPLSEPRSLSIKDPILLGIWPSGAGKTSLSLSVKARPLQRISLGGIRDEAQICTYVASSRGFIIQVFHIASCIDLVILNEVGQSNLHGDLFAALREVLNFKQNWSFNNDYINVPTYLSQD